MKIAYLANIRYPSERAHAVQIAHMCHSFAACGHETVLFVNTRSRADKKEISIFFSLDANYKIVRLTHGIFMPAFKPSYYFNEFLFSFSFLLSQKTTNFDIIYSRHEWIIWLLSMVVNKNKLAWESHEAKYNFPARRILKKGIKSVVISEGILEDYRAQSVPDAQMLIAHDGIDESFFNIIETKELARTRLGLPHEKKIVMYIGGFDGWKGVEAFFRAAKLLPEVLFVAIGGSPEQVRLYREKYPDVLFLGQRPYSELKNNQQAADVLVIPNSAKNALSSRYTSPLKLFAHMASEVPVLVTNIPSLTVVTGNLVTVCSPDDPASIARETQNILENYPEKTQMAQELKKRSVSYTWTERARAILRFIK